MKNLLLALMLLVVLPDVSAQSLRIMTYNIHVGQDAANKDQLKNMADFIKDSKADLVGLQEVDSVCKRTGGIDQIKFLAENTGMYYTYTRHFAFDGGSYGIGILSRYPLSDIQDHRVILTSDGKTDAATRAFLTASIFNGTKKVTFATIHMDYRDSNSRVAQSKDMVAKLKAFTTPVILTGDFNARPGTTEITTLREILADTGSDLAYSFPVAPPLNKIDYIMVSKGNLAKVSANKVIPVLYSDHLPVVSDIRLKFVK